MWKWQLLHLQSELLQIFIVFNIRIHGLPNNFSPFLPKFLTPLVVFFFSDLGLFLLFGKGLAYDINEDNHLRVCEA